jgi:hypothetical protein
LRGEETKDIEKKKRSNLFMEKRINEITGDKTNVVEDKDKKV